MQAIQLQITQREPFQKMRATIKILEADEYFKKMVIPWIDFENETINWDQIFKFSWSPGRPPESSRPNPKLCFYCMFLRDF